jgi:hypothetical protein
MRVGSAFADTHSASLAAELFQDAAIIDEFGTITLDESACMRHAANVCTIYHARSTDLTKMGVVDLVREVLAKRKARRWRKRIRENGAQRRAAVAAATSYRVDLAYAYVVCGTPCASQILAGLASFSPPPPTPSPHTHPSPRPGSPP